MTSAADTRKDAGGAAVPLLAAASAVPAGRRDGGVVRLLVGLFKLRIGSIIAATAMAGAALQPGPALGALQLTMLFIGVLLAAAAAGGFNQYHEADVDARMQRTRSRPFVTGRLVRRRAWLGVLAAMAAAGIGTVAAFLNPLAALYTALGAFFYGVVYTVWLKRRTVWNIVVGGAAGSFAVLAGAAAVNTPLAGDVWLLALIVFLWTPPHFWSLAIVCRADYAAAGVPMLPVVRGDAFAARAVFGHVVALVVLSWVLAFGTAGWVYAACAVAGGVLFLKAGLRLLMDGTRLAARRCFVASLAQYSLLLIGLMLDAAMRA